MSHTKIINKLKEYNVFKNLPEQNIEACEDTLDKFILKYCPSDDVDKFLTLPQYLVRSFCIIVGLFENPDKEIKLGITIDSIINTISEHYENFEKIHKNSLISSDDIHYFDIQMINLFLE